MIKKNQTAQAALDNILDVLVVGRVVGSLDVGAMFGSSRVSQPDREAVSSPQNEIQYRPSNQ